MATIGTIATNVVMRTAPFEQGAKRVVSATKSMMSGTAPLGKTMGSLASQFGGVGGAMGSVLSAAGPVAAGIAAVGIAAGAAYVAIGKVADAFQRIDETREAAAALGLRVESFTALQHGAQKAGVDVAGFATAIKKMENAAADAAEGGAIDKTFAKLNIDAAKFKALAPETQLEVLADKFRGVTNQADRTAIATDLFGKQGVKMLNVLENGSAGLQQMKDDAAALGITFSEFDARRIDAANDAWSDVGATLDGIWNQVAIELAPAWKDLATSITDMLKENMPLIKKFTSFMAGLAEVVFKVADATVALGKGLMDDIIEFSRFFGLIDEKKKTVKEESAKPNVARDPVDPISKEMKSQASQIFEATRTPQEQFAKKMEDLNRLLGVGAINQETYNRAAAAGKSELEKAITRDAPKVEKFREERIKERRAIDAPQALERGSSAAAEAFFRNMQASQDPGAKAARDNADKIVNAVQRVEQAVIGGQGRKAAF